MDGVPQGWQAVPLVLRCRKGVHRSVHHLAPS